MSKPKKRSKLKTFSYGGFFVGLICAYAIGSIIGILEVMSSNPLYAMFILLGIYLLCVILLLGYALDNERILLKSFAIGLLGAIIGIITEGIYNNLKTQRPEIRLAIMYIISYTITVSVVVFISII